MKMACCSTRPDDSARSGEIQKSAAGMAQRLKSLADDSSLISRSSRILTFSNSTEADCHCLIQSIF
jgi:hypothetical protein